MTEHKRLVDNIQSRLAFYVSNLKISTDRDYFDEHKEAEYFFCKPLSLLFDANVTNINSERRNFPGIDLADRNKRISFQITSTNTKQKVQHTLNEFLDNDLDKDFDRVIVLIVGDKTPPPCANLTFKRPFDFDVKRDVWNISRLIQEFEALPADDRHKLRGFSDYLDAELPNYIVPPRTLVLPLVSALQATGFVGREAELAEIAERFEQGDKLVVLTGLGGMGKTELAVKFGRDYAGAVYFARFDTSFTKTLANMAVGIRPALSDEELRQSEGTLCAIVLELLSKADTNDLLIIDNADSDTGSLADLQKDAGYKALTRLPLKILLTTRSDWDEGIPVERIADEHLRKILTRYGATLTDEEMDAIIKTVNGHTLTIDLIARTLNGKGLKKVTAEMMIKALKDNTLPSEKYRKIATHYNQSTEQAQIYQHLSTVFNVSEISNGDKELLRCATLFPENGISGDLMAGIMSEDGITQLESLMERGWLEMKDDLLTIHPVIRLVCRTELEPTDENCKDFLNALWWQLDIREYNRVKFAQLAEVFALAADQLKDPEAEWINHSGRLRLDLAQYEAARALYEKHLPTLEKHLKAPSQLATVYNNLGSIYDALSKHSKALEFKLNALEICKKVLPPEHPRLAASYNNVGSTYGNLGNHSRALEFQLKALEICKKVLPPEHPHLAASYSNVGSTYGNLGDHSKALEFQLNALEICKKVLPPEHPYLATSYNNVGTTYAYMADFPKAVEYVKKALEIREKVLPSEHPHIEETRQSLMNIRFAAMLQESGVSQDDFIQADDAKREKILQEIATSLRSSQ